MKTLYDTLGLVPGCDAMEINMAFNALVRAELDTIDYPRGSMWWYPRLLRIKNITIAMETLSSTDRRDIYHGKLAAAGLVCSLCEGKGRLQYGRGTFVTDSGCTLECAACKGTGKGIGSYE